MENSAYRRWTIIYMIRTDQGLWNQTKEMMDNLLTLKINPKTALIICLSAEIQYLKQIDSGLDFPPKEDITKVTTVFYSMELLEHPVNGQMSKFKLLKKNSNFNIRNPRHIEKYFSDIILTGYRAVKYLLFTWGHGAAYGLFPRGNIPKSKLGKPVRPIKWDMLSISGLANAIKSTFGNQRDQKINLVIMMNCFMQLFDTGLSLSNAGVDYLVASENTESAVGYNYLQIFDQLFNHPEMDSRELATLAVYSLDMKNYPDKTGTPGDPLQDTAYFANDLRLYNRMAGLMDKLSMQLINFLKTHFQAINDAVNACVFYGGNNYSTVDLFRFTEQLRKKVGVDLDMDIINQINHLKNEIVVQEYWGIKLKTEFPLAFPLGISVNLPRCNEGESAFYVTYARKGSPYASEFARNHYWSLFVKKFLHACKKNTGS
jgi:Clostripain family